MSELEKSPTIMLVVAAALDDGAGRLLMQKRPPGKQHGGLWEFPGGKVEPGETTGFALVRELNEELGIAVAEGDLEPAAFAEGAPDPRKRAIVILLYTIRRWQGKPVAEPDSEIGWFRLDEIEQLDVPPLDKDLIATLRKCPG